jgi:hypothetical protein
MRRRRKPLWRGFAGLGEADGSRAVQQVAIQLRRLDGVIREGQEAAGAGEPGRAIHAEENAKVVLAAAEAAARTATAAGVFVPGEYKRALERARRAVEALGPLIEVASERYRTVMVEANFGPEESRGYVPKGPWQSGFRGLR